MKKKGFTLIELLAVIVILAVIALIATPAVLNIIEDSKKSAAEASARNIASAAKAYYMSNLMNNISTSTIDLSNSSFKYDGEQATKGYLTYDSTGNAVGKMYVSGYCIEITESNTTSTKMDESECEIKLPAKTYANGEVVYFNVTTGTKCTNYTESQSATGVKSGCMKFYAFNDDGSDTINLLLDHNTTASVSWSSGSIAPAPKDVIEQLKLDTSSWVGTITPDNYSVDQSSQPSKAKYTIDYSTYKARLITISDIAKITGNASSNEITLSSRFYFDTNTTTPSETCKYDSSTKKYIVSGCKYGWLYDRTSISCTKAGCLNNSDVEYSNYWTATLAAYDSDFAFKVTEMNTSAIDFPNAGRSGVRPVITVNKSLLN